MFRIEFCDFPHCQDILDGSRETLVALGIVVLEANLELNSLDEITALLAVVGLIEKVLDRASHA